MKNFDHAKFVNDLLGIDWNITSRSTDDINVVVNLWTNVLFHFRKAYPNTKQARL